MRSINLLFLIIFLTISLGGCSTLFGPANPSPVVSAGAPQAADTTRGPGAGKPVTSSANTAPNTSTRPPASNSQATTRSPDALFVALAALGIDYHYGGHSAATGFDCSGLVAYVYRRTSKLVLPRLAGAQARAARPIEPADLRAADLVFYNTLGEEFSHVGIYIGQERFVHAPATGSWVQIARISAPYWRARYNGARRVIT